MADDKITPRDIYDELTSAGASTIQAVAIMGNMIAESGLNPEASGTDSNGYDSYGLVQWNAASYPSAATLVTGNPSKDLKAQIRFLAQTGGFRAASGGTPQEAASNFARNYERCQTCGSGGAQNSQRQTNAQQVAGWAAGGDWPTSIGSASDTATLTSAVSSQAQSECLWEIGAPGSLFELGPVHFGPSTGPYCIFSKSQGRAILGTSILVGGILLGMFGVSAIILTAIGESPAARRIANVGLGAAEAIGIPELAAMRATRSARVRTNTGSSPTGSVPPPARSTGTNTPPRARRTGGPASQQPPKRTGGRTQQGTQKKKGP